MLRGLLSALVMLPMIACPRALSVGTTLPALNRIHMVTLSSADPASSAERYAHWFGYRQVESGMIDSRLARSWGATAAAGAAYVLLQAPESEVYLRFVATKLPADYQPLRTAGWSALELLVQNPYSLAEHLADSPFQRLGDPAPLFDDSSIHATQFLGPDGEVLYFTADLGPIEGSTLDRAETPVGRPFILVLAIEDRSDAWAAIDAQMPITPALSITLPIPLLANAQQQPVDQGFPLRLYRLHDFSHSLEIDGYPSAPTRPRVDGHLPPGVSVVTFCADFTGTANDTPLALTGKAYARRPLHIARLGGAGLAELLDCDANPRP